jgi:signal recognition particle subunit SRP54
MKRKAEEQAAAERREQGGAAGRPGAEAPQNFELPDEFKKFMG